MLHDGPEVCVNLPAVARNYQLLTSRFAGSSCAGVVKANAYGLGAKEIVACLLEEGCHDFFVATLDEALELSPLLRGKRLFVFHGVGKGEEKDYIAHSIIPVLSTLEQVERWKKAGEGNPCAVQIDSGMTRLGLSLEELQNLQLATYNVQLLMSHLACAGDPSHPLNAVQRDVMKRARAQFPALPISLANSSGIFLSDDFHFDLARPGCALYGITPFDEGENPMENVVELTAPILQLRHVKKAVDVGYGATYTAKAGAVIATIAYGYADGMPRNLGNIAKVYRGDIAAPVIGRVSMDMIMADVSHIPANQLHEGARVTIIGACQPVDSVARAAGTIGYEIFTRMGKRVKRTYKGF